MHKLVLIFFLPFIVLFWFNYFFFKIFPYFVRRKFIWNENNYKSSLIKKIGTYYKINQLIETGTYLGDTSAALSSSFKKIYTVELNRELFKKTTKRLSKFKNVFCYNLSSDIFLKNIISKIKVKSIFFLDAHYSGPGTSKDNNFSCLKELYEIKKSKIKNHIIIIDDISDFSTFEENKNLSNIISAIEKISCKYKFYFDYDMLFAIPNEKIHREFYKKIIPHFIIR